MFCNSCGKTSEELEQLAVSRSIDKTLKKDKKLAKREIKMLLLGSGESGKSTFIKQMRIIHGTGFTPEERKEYYAKLVCQNIFMSMQSMINAMDKLEISYDDPGHIDLADLITIMCYEDVENLNEPFLSAIKTLWADTGIQQCYDRRSEYQLIDSTCYFLDKVDAIAHPDYLPSDEDVLHCRSATTGLQEYSFMMNPHRLIIFDVGGQRSERRKWLHCFDNINVLIFLVAISEYDQKLQECEDVNRMEESKALYKEIVNSHWFEKAANILFFNKIDLFNEKIKKKHFAEFFCGYTGPQRDAMAAREYIKNMFTDLNVDEARMIYVHYTCATDTGNIRLVNAAVRDIILSHLMKDLRLA